MRWFANDFHERRVKIIGKSHHEWPKHRYCCDNECIILFLTRCSMFWSRNPAKDNHKSFISPFSPSTIFSDLELSRHHSCSQSATRVPMVDLAGRWPLTWPNHPFSLGGNSRVPTQWDIVLMFEKEKRPWLLTASKWYKILLFKKRRMWGYHSKSTCGGDIRLEDWVDLWRHANARYWHCDVIFIDCSCTCNLAKRRSTLVNNNREYRLLTTRYSRLSA